MKKTFILLNILIEVDPFLLKPAPCEYSLDEFSNAQKYCSKPNCSMKSSVDIISLAFSRALIKLVFKRTDRITFLQYLGILRPPTLPLLFALLGSI